MAGLEIGYNNSVFFDYTLHYDNKISVVEHIFRVLYMVGQILIFCVSVPGNSFLLWALLRERSWKTTPDIWLLQLTVSDLCLAVTLPVWAYTVFCDWIFEDWSCKLMNGLYFLGLNSYVLIITAMMLSHHDAVVHARRSAAQARQKYGVLIETIVIWMVCGASSIMVSVYSETNYFNGTKCLYIVTLIHNIMHIGLFFLIPLLITTFCCVHMWITIKLRKIDTRYQASRLNMGIIVVFFLFMVPFFIIFFIEYLMIYVLERVHEWTQAMHFAQYVILLLPDLHCCLNPLVHIFGLRRFRRHLSVPCNTSSQRGDVSQNVNSTAVHAFDSQPLLDQETSQFALESTF